MNQITLGFLLLFRSDSTTILEKQINLFIDGVLSPLPNAVDRVSCEKNIFPLLVASSLFSLFIFLSDFF